MKQAPPEAPSRAARPPAELRPAAHGLTLAALVAQRISRGRTGLPLSRVRRIVTDIAPALDALHTRRAPHGYVQARFILTPSRRAACLVRPGEAPASASPSEDRRNLAATTYFALTGEPPTGLLTDTPRHRRPDLPPAVADVIMRGLTTEPGYPSASAFAAALDKASREPRRLRGAALFRSPVGQVLAVVALVVLVAWAWQTHARPGVRPKPARVAARPAPQPVILPTPQTVMAAVPPVSHRIPSARHVHHIVVRPAPRTRVLSKPLPVTLKSRPTYSMLRDTRKPGKAASTAPASRPRRTAKPHSVSPPRPHRPKTVPQHPAPKQPAPPHAVLSHPAQRHAAPPLESFLRVYARQILGLPRLGSRTIATRIRPRLVRVDGRPSPALASGQWVALKPGVHHIAFYPAPGSPFDANTNLIVRVPAHGRRQLQVPLPRRLTSFTSGRR